MIKDAFPIKGELQIILRDILTEEVRVRNEKNLVVSVGKQFIASRMASNTTPVMSTMAVGTNNTAPAAGDVALGAQLVSVSLSVAGGTPSGNTVLYKATFPPGVGTGALVEAGIFGSIMLSRTTFPVINKGANDEMIINWTLTVG
mgnify:CR=1 FL=1